MSKISNFLYRALEKTKVDIKIRFFMRKKTKFRLYSWQFSELSSPPATQLILIRHSSLSIYVREWLARVASCPQKMSRRTVKLNDTEVIIIISKPRRRLTHTWNPFFVLLGMRKGQRKHTQTHPHTIHTHKWEESQTRSAALKAPFFQRLDSSVCVKKISCSSARFLYFLPKTSTTTHNRKYFHLCTP